MNSYDIPGKRIEQEEKYERNMNSHIDVLVIGAGPVGLRFLIEILKKAKQNSKQNFVIGILERNRTYTRTQELKLKSELFADDAQLKKMLLELIRQGKAKHDTQENIQISIQELETCLAAYADGLGVKIDYKRFMTTDQYVKALEENNVKDHVELEGILKVSIIVGREDIARFYPKCKMIFFADGARSSGRQLITRKDENASVKKTDFRYLVEVTYLAQGEVQKLAKWNYYRSQALLYGFLCSESIKYLKDKKQSKVIIRFLVNEETFHDPRLNNVNAKNQLPICSDLPLPSLLRKVINIWLSLRKDRVVPDSGTINKTILSIYLSELFAAVEAMQAFFLLGDAVSGFPYMNGLNLGTEQAIFAAELLIKFIDDIVKGDVNALTEFTRNFNDVTRTIFKKGTDIVARRDYEISNSKIATQAIYASSYSIKGPERWYRAGDHPIFHEEPKSCTLELRDLDDYVEKHSGNPGSETYLLSSDLLGLLIKHQRLVVQDPTQVDFDFLKAALSLAYEKNQAIVTRAANRGFLARFSKIQPETAVSKQSRCEIIPEEIKQVIENPRSEIPEQSVETGSLSRDYLHNIIYTLYRSATRLEQRCKAVVNLNFKANRNILMARKDQPAIPVRREVPMPESSFKCLIS